MNESEIINGIKSALEKLKENDKFLLETHQYERTITHKLAEYMEPFFKEFDVDVEWNKGLDGKDQKMRLHGKDVWVVPDIIVHNRKTGDKFVAIEVKLSRASTPVIEQDKVKLKEYKKQIKYKYAFLVIIGVSKQTGESEVIPI